ncbi:MAG: helical backbone metal receptor [Acidobacteriota bacterium]
MGKNQSRKFLRIALIALSLIAVPTCQRPAPQPARRDQPRPARIVSLSPSVTEILYGIGAWSQVVAVSEYCTYPDDVINKPRVNGWGTTNLEQVTALNPDLVIGVDAQEPFVRNKLDAIGVHSLFVKSQSLADIFAAIDKIGAVVGHVSEANGLVASTRNEVDEVRRAVANRQQPRVLCVVDRVPGTLRDIYVATQGSFLVELISVAGGDPIAPPSGSGYGKITKEALLALDPEVIIEMVQGSKGRLGEDPRAVWQELNELRAVKTGRIYSLKDETAIHPSQFVGHTARLFGQYIHPEVSLNAMDEPR